MTTILEKTAGLVAFVRTVEAGSFSTASRLVGSSPSAVAKSVARLERRLGVRLVQRSTRTLKLTAEGSAYYERVAPLLRAIEDAEDVVQKADDARGVLRVTAPGDIGRGLLATWATAFLARHPAVKLELNVSDRRVDLIREGYDVAVRMGSLQDTGLVGRALTAHHTVLVASPDYARQHGLPATVDELHQHVSLRYLLAGRPVPFVFGDGTKIVVDGPFDTDDSEALRRAALNGAGIAQVLRLAVLDDVHAGRLLVVLPDVPTLRVPMHVLHAFGRQLPVRARVFIDFLVERIEACERQAC